MGQDATDIPEGHLAHAGIFVTGEERLAIFPQALVDVHPRAIVFKERLGHECGRLAMFGGHILHDILVDLHPVGHLNHRRKTQVNFRLTGSRYFVMMAFDLEAGPNHLVDHFRADVLEGIIGRDGEITTLVANLVARAPVTGVPGRFITGNFILAGIAATLIAHLIENEEFSFRTAEHRVGNAGCLQMRFGFTDDIARVTVEDFVGDRFIDIGDHAQGRVFANRVEKGCGRITDQDHVAAFNRLETTNGRAVKAETSVKEITFVVVIGWH